MTPSEILFEYNERETAAGGLARVDPREIAEQMARDLGLPWVEVQEALLSVWSLGYSG